MEQKKKQLFKILIIGDQQVGKSNILSQYAQKKFTNQYRATIGADFLTKDVQINGQNIVFQLWDTAGQERFQSLGSAFFRGSDGVVLVYDINNQNSCDKLQNLKLNFMQQSGTNLSEQEFPIVVVANKIDKLENQKILPKPQLLNLEQEKEITSSGKFFECSAKDNQGLDQAFEQLAIQILNQQKNKDLNYGLIENDFKQLQQESQILKKKIQNIQTLKKNTNYQTIKQSQQKIYKILVLGDESVGKTSIIQQSVQQKYYEIYQPTIGVDFMIKNYQFQNQNFSLQIWDVSGYEKKLSPLYCKGCDGLILVYDINNQKSCKNLQILQQEFFQKSGSKLNQQEFPTVIVANKKDKLEGEKILPNLELLNLQEDITESEKFVECSAKENTGINLIFDKLVQQIISKKVYQEEEEDINQFISKKYKKMTIIEKRCSIF